METRGVWRRLHQSGASQSAISFGWRLLHAALPVRSKVAHCLGRPLEEGLCEAPGCSCQESLSHALMDCEKVRGAIDWLLDLFEAISGRRPPRDPRVILADDHRVWGAGGAAEEQLLWQRLRLTVLSHIWRVRSSRQRYQRRGDGDLSEEVIRGASTEIQQAIRRDWARTRLVDTQEEAGGGFCGFSGRDPSLTKAAFLKLWAGNNVLCHPSSLAAGGLYVCDPAGWLPPRAGGTGGGHRGGGGGGTLGRWRGESLTLPPGSGEHHTLPTRSGKPRWSGAHMPRPRETLLPLSLTA